jgi:hypothetical protein
LFIGTIIIISPWLIEILLHHGLTFFLPLLDSGFSRWDDIQSLVLVAWTREPFFPVISLFALVGMYSFFKARNLFMVLWLPLIFILQGRAADQRTVVPIAILAGEGIISITNQIKIHLSSKKREWSFVAAIFGLFIYSLYGSLVVVTPIDQPISKDFLSGIEWLRSNSSINATFIVVSGKDWILDDYSEWIIALTGRKSISVVQGYEWVPGFSNRILQNNQLQYEYSNGITEMTNYMNKNNIRADYLIFPKNFQTGSQDLFSKSTLFWKDAAIYLGGKIDFENEGIVIIHLSPPIGY